MKGVILAGGTGCRLYPLTRVTNKHLLPVYNKPMIFYPIHSLKSAGITDILIVSGRGHSGDFLELLGSGAGLGVKISYDVQEEPGGIAQALSLTERFVKNEKFVVILGDNIFEKSIQFSIDNFKEQKSGARILLKKVKNPESYGVAEISGNSIVSIVEKPKTPISDFAVLGCYMFDGDVFEIIKSLKPSARGELEITDVNNAYLKRGDLMFDVLDGFWGDCGESFDSLLEAGQLVVSSGLKHLGDGFDTADKSVSQSQL